jgi:hypothetical protein
MKVKLEIEGIFKVTDRGLFVIAKRLEPKVNFYITKKSFLGGVELMEFLDIPRSIDENGEQRDVVALQIKNTEDASRLIKGTTVDLEPVDSILYLKPWVQVLSDNEVFEEELRKEIAKKHILHGKNLKVIGRRLDNDDILIELDDESSRFAVVHLTWAKHVEANPSYPYTELLTNWVEVYNKRKVPEQETYS